MKRTIPFLIIALLAPLARAELTLDNIQFDPAIIASGDRVDIVVQFHDTATATAQQYVGDPTYTFKVTLQPDDTLTQDYILIEDSEGNDLQGIITRGAYFNKRFRVKVNDNAPAGSYEFKLTGQWYKDGQPTDSLQYIRFSMPVKKQGIALSVANVISSPEKVRSGDKDVLLTTTLVNTGEKTAKNVRLALAYPDGITSSYTNDNVLNAGSIAPGGQQPVQLYIDTERAMKEGRYAIAYTLRYQDTDNNEYVERGTFPIVIKKRPDIVVVRSEGEGLAGGSVTLRVTVQNLGEETADAVDVRLLTQSSQPFEMDVRSDYLGQLAPGENGTAIFTIGVQDDAEIKEHKLSAIIRAKGDSEEGDDNVYTFTDAATLDVTGRVPNRYPLYAAAFLALVIIGAIVAMRRKK